MSALHRGPSADAYAPVQRASPISLRFNAEGCAMPDLYEISRAVRDTQSRMSAVDHKISRLTAGRADRLTPAAAIIRSTVCKLIAQSAPMPSETAEDVCERLYGRTKGAAAVRRAVSDLGAVLRAAVNPAQTTVAGWAAELAASENYSGALPDLTPASAYAQLTQHGLRLTFGSAGTIKVPGRSSAPNIAGDFISEGQAIPVRRLGATATSVGPVRKLAVISTFTEEMAMWSIPSIEGVLRDVIAADTGTVLDTRMLDANAATTARPAGLLNGVTPTAATAGGGAAALGGDLAALSSAVPNAVDFVLIMNPGDAMRAVALMPGLAAAAVIMAPTLTARSVIALDAADFVSAEGDAPRFDVSGNATLHEDDAAGPISIVGTPNTVAAPTRSLYQTNAIALRMLWWVVWQMRRPGRVATIAAVTW
jgi:hypothetical protein